MDFLEVGDVGLALVEEPRVVAADDLEVLQFFVAFVGVAHKKQPVVMQVGERVDAWVSGAVVGVFPVIDDGFHAQAEVAAEVL